MSELPAVTPGQHWLYGFIDKFGLHDDDALSNAFQSPQLIPNLYDLATGVASCQSLEKIAMPSPSVIVGGVGLEIDPRTSCPHFECRKPSIDRELGQILHYFDYVVLNGPRPDNYKEWIERIGDWHSKEYLARLIVDDLRTLNYLRQIGASEYVYFLNKPEEFCTKHHELCAHELGLAHLSNDEGITQVARKIVREGGVKSRRTGPDEWGVWFTHPALKGVPGKQYSQKMPPPAIQIVEGVIKKHVQAMVSDLVAAKQLGSPMAATSEASFLDGPRASTGSIVDEVSALLALPVLASLSTREVVMLRQTEAEHFERFRLALKAAVVEAVEKAGSADPQKIALDVQRNYVEAGLAEIDQKLRASSKSVSRKMAVGASVGLATAAFGAITAIPLVVAAGIAAAATPLTQVYKYFDDKQSIEVSDMYFLWKAARKGGHRKSSRRKR